MAPLSVAQWDRLSDDALWSLATDWQLAAEVREEAMRRWLFPAEYGYGWASRRVQQLRARYLGTEQDKRFATFAAVPASG